MVHRCFIVCAFLMIFLFHNLLPGAPRSKDDLDLTQLHPIGEATFPTGYRFNNVELGGLSGITYDSQQHLFYAVSDDFGKRAPARFYTLKIDLHTGKLTQSDVQFVKIDTLLAQNGQPYVIKSISPEGIAHTQDDRFYISSEGAGDRTFSPFIGSFSRVGRETGRLNLPAVFSADSAGTTGARPNYSFESLCLSPDGKTLFSAVENALTQDGPPASLEHKSPVRLIRFDLKQNVVSAEYLYWVDRVAAPPSPKDGFADNGLSELIALDNNRLLALERSYSAGVGNTIKLYEVLLDAADNIAAISRLNTYDVKSIKPVTKRLVLKLTDHQTLDNLEGMTLGPILPDGSQSLILVSDNNFNPKQKTLFMAFAIPFEGMAINTSIPKIQGSVHISPLAGRKVKNVTGIVTAIINTKKRHGFWLQDEKGDGNGRTSDGIYISTGNKQPGVTVGNKVQVAGLVKEFGFRNQLTVTQIDMESIETVSTGHPLPAAVIIGRHGFKPPTTVIEDDRMRDFDPQNDALDFYEQFEGMRVQINKPVVVGPTSRFGEFVVLADNGKDASVRSKRGGILLRKNDPNPERIFVSTSIAAETPSVNVGDRFDGAIVGVLDYTFGNFKIVETGQLPPIKPANLKPEKTNLQGGKDRLTVATYNVENLDFLDPDSKFQHVAKSIVENLASPDIIGLQEIQDNDGAKNDGIVDAAKTFTLLIDAIQKADGPVYDFCQTNPVNNADGGQPGGNIRVGFLFNQKHVHFEKRNEEADSTQVQYHDDGPFLTANPGRLAFHRKAFNTAENR